MCAVLSAVAFAQQETGQINGKVVDPNGAAVPGATVTAKNVGTAAERTVTTDQDGAYIITNLQPGIYDVTATGTGFQPGTQRAQVTTGGRLTLDVPLGVAGVGATVNVVAGEGGAEVNTQDQQLGNIVNNRQIRELPTLTRNPYALVGLSGNVSAEPGGGRGTGYNINGQRSASTSILLDGTENVDTFTATVGQSVPLDSVQEFRVITGNFSAEYGRASGGVVNVSTLSGSNQFHGTAYEFNRISRLASNGFDNNARGIRRQVFTRNQFGYSVGGPIKRDKLFFFSSTEWIRVRSGGASVAWVPSSQFIAASAAATRAFFAPYQITGTTGSTLTASQVLAGFGGAAAFAPTPNASTNAFLAFAQANPNTPVFQQVTYSTPEDVGGGTPENEYQTVGRIDYNLSQKTQLYGRYALQSQVFALGTNASSPYDGFNTGSTNFNQNMLLNLTHTFSPRFVSQTKIAYNRLNGGQPLGTQPLVPTLYMNAGRTVNLQGVRIAFPGYLPFSPGNAIPFNGAQNVYQLNQDATYTVGKHTWRMGGQVVHIRDNKTFGAYSYAVEGLGNTNGEALSNFLTGNLVLFQVAIDPGNRFPGASIPLPVGPPAFSRSNRYTEWAVYGNDSWRVQPRLTLNLGLRYEYYGVQHNAQNPSLDANFYFGGGNTIYERIANATFQTAPQSGIGGLWRPDRNNFAPRLGFAWDVKGDGKTSVRGGYGIAYERNFGNVTFNVLFKPPNYGVVALAANSNNSRGQLVPGDVATLPISIANYGPFSGTGPARPFAPVSARAVNPNIVNAYAHFWSASFEHQISPGTLFSLEYSGSRGADLYSISDINRTGLRPALGLPNILNAVGGVTSRLNPFATSVNQRGNLGVSIYHAMIASLESNNWRKTGLTFTARYTLARAKDNLSSTFAETGQTFFLGFTDTFNPMLDYGYADFDVRHRFAGSFNYEVPLKGDSAAGRYLLSGWSLNGILTMRSGYPFTIYDCSFANQTCGRLVVGSNGLKINNGNPPSTGDPNSFTLVDLSAFRDAAGNVINPALPNPIIGNYNVGPFPNVNQWSRRNAFRGPGLWDVTMGLYKRIRFTERYSLQLRAEAFNVFNHANLFVDYGSPDVSSGNVLAYRDGRRNVQLAAKFIF
ncbi:MAG: TonB-dependent receptor [Acidobacteriota bacterium]|nr:TonB-dependent receptor [Acidobacteriota bacterium]